jgi:aspartyl-tRNA(Asn)/glutamyl-tRNA(Gln) amidotransferase subunit B
MRLKEELNDYRYFPDPDLSPVIVSEEWLAKIKAAMPALPWELRDKFVSHYGLSTYDAQVLTESKGLAAYFEDVCKITSNYKSAANWVMGPVKSYLNELTLTVTDFPISVKTLAELIQMIDSNTVSFSTASQRLFPELLKSPEKLARQVAEELNLIQNSDSESILSIIEEVMSDYPAKVQEYKKGKVGIVGMFMGEVMKRSKGKADPKVANALLLKKLTEE